MTTFASTIRAGVLGVALAGAAAAWPAYACGEERNEGSKQSDIGAVTGLAVGAAAGGPLGAVLGAAAGALLGDRYHRQAQARAALAADLDKSEAERERLTRSVTQLDGTLAQAQTTHTQLEAQRTQLDETVQHTDELSFEVGFRTNDDSIPAARVPPLLKLGGLLASMPQAPACGVWESQPTIVSPGMSKASMWAQWLMPFPGPENRAPYRWQTLRRKRWSSAFSYPVWRMLWSTYCVA